TLFRDRYDAAIRETEFPKTTFPNGVWERGKPPSIAIYERRTLLGLNRPIPKPANERRQYHRRPQNICHNVRRNGKRNVLDDGRPATFAWVRVTGKIDVRRCSLIRPSIFEFSQPPIREHGFFRQSQQFQCLGPVPGFDLPGPGHPPRPWLVRR